jgi:hypothetical protein
MLYHVDEVVVGQQVVLFPHTKTASNNVHRQRVVTIMKDPKAHWPKVMVCWKEDGEDRWELVHKDNIKKRVSPTHSTGADRHQGDSVGDGGAVPSKWQRKLAIGTPVQNHEDQMGLF